MKQHLEKSMIATVNELQSIASRENGETFVSLEGFSAGILCDYRRKDSEITKVLVRIAVAEKLKEVQKKLSQLDPRMQLLLVEGYRSPMYQERYYLKQLLEQAERHPEMDFDELIEAAHQFVALPTIAGHPTGGAVDLTIACEGQETDMGGKIADFSSPELLPTYSPLATSVQAKNRALLHDLMISEGFAPFYGEWWHFSYGDREWAAFYHLPQTLYAPINISQVLLS